MARTPGQSESVRGVTITTVYGLIGWAVCGMTMGAAMAATRLDHALVIHALAAPVIFAALSCFFFRRFEWATPVRTAAVFVGVVIGMDLCVVALLIERSFAMFESILGTWLPFILIFVATWRTGVVVRRAAQQT